MPTSSSPLAEQTRGLRWWLRAIRRSPALAVLIVVQFLMTPLLWTLWEPSAWVKLLVTMVIVVPTVVLIGGVRERTARAIELADETAERTGRRRPVSAGIDAELHSAFTWRSRMGRHLIVIGVFWTSASLFGIAAMARLLLHDDPPRTLRDAAISAALVLLLVIAPAAMLVLNFGGLLRQVQRIAADPAERAYVTVIGVDPETGQWVLERPDDGYRLSARLLSGRRLLVSGDELLAEGTLTKPRSHWRRPLPAMFALTGPFGTLWAQHGNLPTETMSRTTATGVPHGQHLDN